MDKAYYKEYFHLERKHWWFQARMRILRSQMERILADRKNENDSVKILNAGVATGATSEMLNQFGQVTSLEYDNECCDFLRTQVGIDAICGSLTELPFEDSSFDVVCAFDVVEHIEDDHQPIAEIHRVLKPGGIIFLTVPAYQFLWSKHDEVNHHFRRYTKSQLTKLINTQSFEIVYKSYFNTILFSPIALVRGLSNLVGSKNEQKVDNSGSDFEVLKGDNPINRLMYHTFKSENALLKKGVSFPFGVSIMVIGQKEKSTLNKA